MEDGSSGARVRLPTRMANRLPEWLWDEKLLGLSKQRSLGPSLSSAPISSEVR